MPLPPYRFIPRLAPHPSADPAGHSYGRAGEPDGGRAGYLAGIDLYNRGMWWEAHEAWEAVWLEAGRGSPYALAVQGLIQVANAHLKLEEGRARAVHRLRRKYAELFARAGAATGDLGFDFAPWRAALDAYLDARLAVDPPTHDIAGYPTIVLSEDG